MRGKVKALSKGTLLLVQLNCQRHGRIDEPYDPYACSTYIISKNTKAQSFVFACRNRD